MVLVHSLLDPTTYNVLCTCLSKYKLQYSHRYIHILGCRTSVMKERGTFVCWETWVGSLVQLQELHSTLCQPIGDEMDNQLAGSEYCYPLYGYNYRRNQFVICLQKIYQHEIVIFPIVANIITSHGKELAEICQVFL